jgi:hypothetical protein
MYFTFSYHENVQKLSEILSTQKNRIFYRFKKSAWVEIFGSKKRTYLGKGGHMVALINAVNFSIEISCGNPW